MELIRGMSASLRWLARHAAVLLAVGVFAGLALPPLATLLRPLLVPAISLTLVVTIARLDWQAMAGHGRRVGLTALVTGWLLLVSPVVVWLVADALGAPAALVTALTLMAAAPAIMSAPAFALILGLDAPLAVVVVTVATLATPFTLPPVALALLDLDLGIGLAELMLRLAAIIGGTFAAAYLFKRLAPAGWIAARTAELDGVAVVALLVFAVGIMDGVTARLIERPGFVMLCIAAAFAANLALQAAGALIFSATGMSRALTLGFASGNRNMGLVLAVLADKADFDVVVFFAVGQLPMYILPALLRPLYRRLMREG